MDVTTVVNDEAYGKTLGDRLRLLSDTGFLVGKEEVYDARYYDGTYEWAGSTGPRAILIQQPKLGWWMIHALARTRMASRLSLGKAIPIIEPPGTGGETRAITALDLRGR